jgi:hypothetical protein
MANPERITKKFSRYLIGSYGALAAVLLIFILTSVILDSVLAAAPMALQRWLIVLTLILPALFGMVMGVLELRQPGRRLFLACIAILLNGLVALFFMALLGIAG